MKLKSRILKLLFLLLPCICAGAASSQYQFHHLSTEQGLSHITVNDVYQDETGRMWFATRYGLNSYDGGRVKQYFLNKESMSLPLVTSVTGDGRGHLYLIAHQALLEFDLRTEQFRNIIDQKIACISKGGGCIWFCSGQAVYRFTKDTESLKFVAKLEGYEDATLYCITEVSDGVCWVGSNRGAFRIENEKAVLVYPGYEAREIFEDSKGRIWFCTSDGLHRHNPDGTVRSYKSAPDDSNSLINDNVRCICEDRSGKIWIGSQYGLCKLNPDNDRFERFVPDRNIPNTLSAKSVTSLLCDRLGTVWISTYFGGVNYLNPYASGYKYHQEGSNGLNFPIIGKFAQDADGTIWIGTEGDGLYSYDRDSDTFKHFPDRKNGRTNIKEIAYDSERNCLWLGYPDNGIKSFDLNTHRYKTHNIRFKNPIFIPYKSQFLMGSSQCLAIFNPDSPDSVPEPFSGYEKRISILSLLKDSQGMLWIGTKQGLTKYDSVNNKLFTYRNVDNDISSISGDIITSICEDREGNIWAVAMEGGLNRYMPQTDSFRRCCIDTDGSGKTNITAMCPSPSGNILLGTSHGVCLLNPHNETAINIGPSNGFPLSMVNEGSIFISATDDIYVGGINGMVVFKEDNFHDIAPKPNSVWLSQLLINNKEILCSDDSGILSQSLRFCSGIRLKYDYSLLSIRPVTDNYIPSKHSNIEYRLSNYNDNWMDLSEDGLITYTGLRPGKYTLDVRVKEFPDVSSSLSIHIIPPLYNSWYAWCFYAFVICIGIFLIYRNARMRLELRTSLEFEKREKEQIQEMARSKFQFITNMSHELNTPLTMIIAQVDTLLRDYTIPDDARQKVNSIHKNTDSLRSLIKRILEFKKWDEYEGIMDISKGDIIALLDEIFLAFEEYAEDHGVLFEYDSQIRTAELWFDEGGLKMALGNILANAFKFTPNGGVVTLAASEDDEYIRISVSDTGIGINPDKIEQIFEYFYRAENDSEYEGFGIGLSFAKHIVEGHKGKISARNREDGHGAIFEVQLKKGCSHIEIEPHIEPESVEYSPKIQDGEDFPRLLIVEDNKELAQLLVSTFSHTYKADAAYSAEVAIEKIKYSQPDIIISDVALPEMSGIRLCKTLKNDLNTSHIPIVLLTARTSIEHQLKGLKAGADDYITKPFDIQVLVARCNNILHNRRVLQVKFFKKMDTDMTTSDILTSSTIDAELIRKMRDYILDNIQNDSLNINSLATELGLSRTALFNKTKALIGMSPNRFIINLKLKKASEMLKNHPGISISEIAYELGFNSPKYFATCFRNEFGCTPSEYRSSLFGEH